MIKNDKMNIRVKNVISNLNPNIEILNEYKDKNTLLHFKCRLCNCEWYKTYTNTKHSFAHCPNCQNEHRKSIIRLSREDVQSRLDKANSNILLIGDYIDLNTKTIFKCKKCGTETYRRPSYIFKGYGCPECAKYNTTGYATKGINDIATERPDLVKYFVDIKDTYRYRKMSSMKVLCKCPDCGNIKEQIISNLTQQGFSCPMCSDGLSYPNKFGRVFVEQLPVNNIITEFSPYWAGKYRYDIYFEHDNCKYIIEMDGKWHYCDNYLSGQSVKQTQEIDKYKEELAKKHDINIIRIDCTKSQKNYIKNNIINSDISNHFDLSDIDWDKCDSIARRNTYKYICDYYNSNLDKSFAQISRDLHIDRNIVSCSLKKGNELGWCHLNLDIINQNKIESSRKSKYIPVNVYTLDYQLVHHFNSIIECSRKMTEIYGVKFRDQNISTSRGKPYKGFIFIKEREKDGKDFCTS